MNDANPYSAPPEEESTLSALRRQEMAVLDFYWQHRDRSPTFNGFCKRYTKVWLVRAFLFCSLILWAKVVPSLWFFGLLLGGVIIGRTLNDVGTIRKSIAFWPLTQKITDWPKVEQLLDSRPD